MRMQRVLNEKITANIKCYSENKMFSKLPYAQKAGHKICYQLLCPLLVQENNQGRI